MSRWYRRAFAALALTMPLSALSLSAGGSAAGTSSSPAGDVLSGTWTVSRTCLTVCVSPKPVLKVVRHRTGNVYVTGAQPPQVLYRMGVTVLVHGPKDSLLLTITKPGRLMSGSGVGADGSTFKTTWRCVNPTTTSAVSRMALAGVSRTKPARAPGAIGVC